MTEQGDKINSYEAKLSRKETDFGTMKETYAMINSYSMFWSTYAKWNDFFSVITLQKFNAINEIKCKEQIDEICASITELTNDRLILSQPTISVLLQNLELEIFTFRNSL